VITLLLVYGLKFKNPKEMYFKQFPEANGFYRYKRAVMGL